MKLPSIHSPRRTVWLEHKVDARDALAVAFEYIEKSGFDDATMQQGLRALEYHRRDNLKAFQGLILV
jgi:hypothetical protein